MSFWSRIRKVVTRRKEPTSTPTVQYRTPVGPSPSTSTKTSTSSGGGGSGSSNNLATSITYTDIPPQQKEGIIVTDTSKGTVISKISPTTGKVTSQTYSGSRGGGSSAIQLANRPGGLVSKSSTGLSSNVITQNKTIVSKPLANTTASQVQKQMNTVEPAPTLSQQWRTSTRDLGFIKGSLYFTGQKVSGGISTGKYSPLAYSGYDKPTGKLASTVVTTGPYFTSAGPALLLAGGIEDVGTSRGRTRISSRGESIGEYTGTGKTAGTVLSYGLTGAEIVGGAFGVRSQFKGIQSARSTALLEKAPVKSQTLRIKKPTGGVDFIKASKTTSPNWADRYLLNIKPQTLKTQVTQPFVITPNKVISLEGGKGQSILYTKGSKKIDVLTFDTFGKVNTVQTAPNLVRNIDGLKVTNTLDDFTSSYGTVTTKGRASASLKVKGYYDPLKETADITMKGIGKQSTARTTTKFIGGGTSEGSVGKIFGGTARKVRVNLDTGTKTLQSGKLNFFGNIKTINVGEGVSGSSGTQVFKYPGGSVGYQQGLTKSALSTTTTQFTKPVSQVHPSVSGITNIVSSIQKPSTTTIKPQTIQTPVVIQQPTQETSTSQFSRVNQASFTPTKTRGRTITAQTPTTIQPPAITQTPKVGQIPVTIPKIIQSPKTTPKTTSGLGFPSPPPISPVTPFKPFIPPFIKPTLGAGSFGGLGKLPAKRKYFYTPSFGYLAKGGIFTKTSKPSKKRYTGLEFRGSKPSKSYFPTFPSVKRRKGKKSRKV